MRHESLVLRFIHEIHGPFVDGWGTWYYLGTLWMSMLLSSMATNGNQQQTMHANPLPPHMQYALARLTSGDAPEYAMAIVTSDPEWDNIRKYTTDYVNKLDVQTPNFNVFAWLEAGTSIIICGLKNMVCMCVHACLRQY